MRIGDRINDWAAALTSDCLQLVPTFQEPLTVRVASDDQQIRQPEAPLPKVAQELPQLFDDLPGPSASVELTLNGLSKGSEPVLIEHFRIDRDHSNAFEVWKRLGSPQYPTPDQTATLEQASQLSPLKSPEWHRATDGRLTLKFTLPRQAVSLLLIHNPSTDSGHATR